MAFELNVVTSIRDVASQMIFVFQAADVDEQNGYRRFGFERDRNRNKEAAIIPPRGFDVAVPRSTSTTRSTWSFRVGV